MNILTPPLQGHSRHHACTLLVLHATAGSDLQGAVDTLRQKGFSYHYIIEKDGTCTKCLPSTNVAYHAGNSYGPLEAESGVSRQQDSASNFVAGCSVNSYSLGVSFVNLNDGQDEITEAQLVTLGDLVEQLKGAFPGFCTVTTHAIVSPGRKTDPITLDLESVANRIGLIPWVPN
jgi:N-acetyl-anhydromuramyl-L-alanine amidase AmpD